MVFVASPDKRCFLTGQGVAQLGDVVVEEVHLQGFFERDESDVGCLVAQADFPSEALDKESQHDHVNAVAIRIDNQLIGIAIDPCEASNADLQTGFFKDFAFDCFRDRFASIYSAAGQAPLAVVAATGEQDLLTGFIQQDGRATQAKLPLAGGTGGIQDMGGMRHGRNFTRTARVEQAFGRRREIKKPAFSRPEWRG